MVLFRFPGRPKRPGASRPMMVEYEGQARGRDERLKQREDCIIKGLGCFREIVGTSDEVSFVIIVILC